MSSTTNPLPDPVAAGALVTAKIVSVQGGRVGLRSDAFGAASARVAAPGYRPRVGDAVLVGSTADGARFVVGVLRALREVPDALVAEDGSRATIESDEEGPALRVRDAAGRLVFEHRPGRSVVHAPEGDLELAAEGRITLTAGESVRVESPELTATAKRARVDVEDASLVVGTLRTVAQRVRERAVTIERQAERVLLRAREVYREVDELDQTRAGRLRLVAERAFSLLSEEATLKARDAVKIKGEKIYLG